MCKKKKNIIGDTLNAHDCASAAAAGKHPHPPSNQVW